MKITFLLLLAIFVISCSGNSQKDSALVKEAEVYMKGAIVEADNWLTDLNKNGYSLYLNQHFPPPFEKALFGSVDSTRNREQFQKWIGQMEQEFGKVKERDFVGIHIITKGKLLTHLANGTQGFSYTSPKLLGLTRVSQMYLNNIEGTYAYLMYESMPTKKDRAEELIVLWLDNNNKWNLITYKIADDI
jgi:hypothetical protein